MKIAIVLPSRGLIFTEVEDAIESQRKQFDIDVYRSWDLPIPDSFNILVERALQDEKVEYIFFVEEDVVIPGDALKRLLAAVKKYHADIYCIDYAVGGWSCVAREKSLNEILWCGLGCTLVKRVVFECLSRPWFRTDKSLRLNDWQWTDNPAKYGGQDIWFSRQAIDKGFTICQVDGECRHLKLDELGKPEINKGLHTISEKPVLTKNQLIEVPEQPKTLTIDGKQVTVNFIGNVPTQL